MDDNVLNITGKLSQKASIETLQKLCFECKDIDIELKKLKDKSAELNDEKTQLRKQILEHLEEHDLKRFDFGDGKVTIAEKTSVKMRDKFKFFDWLREKGIFEDIVSVNAMTLNKIYREEKEKAIDEGDASFIIEGLPGLSEPQTFRDLRFLK